MPMIVKTLDQIACDKQRDVLCISFLNPKGDSRSRRLQARMERSAKGWEGYAVRKAIRKWLTEQGIAHQPCYPMLDDGWIVAPYMGHLYVDVPFDVAHPQYQRLAAHLEDEHEQPRIDGVFFCALLLDAAMKHAASRPVMDDRDW